jgi:exonuclease III
MARNRNGDGGGREAALSFLSLNTNHRADLAGLPSLLRDQHPDFVFLQEVTVSLSSLSAAVSSMGYTVWMSAIDVPRRCIAVLARRPAVDVEYVPGYVQRVDALGLTFLHLHCFNEYHEREHLFQQCRRLIDTLQ